MRIGRQFVLAVALCMSISCLDEPECFSINNNVIGITFKSITDGTSVTIEGITVTADGAAEEFYTSVNTSVLTLPLNNYASQTTFRMNIGDTLYFLETGYEAKSQYVSEECGSRFILGSLQVVNHNFDSVRLVSRTPGRNASARNLEIFWE